LLCPEFPIPYTFQRAEARTALRLGVVQSRRNGTYQVFRLFQNK
jgi:hypothetical protein